MGADSDRVGPAHHHFHGIFHGSHPAGPVDMGSGANQPPDFKNVSQGKGFDPRAREAPHGIFPLEMVDGFFVVSDIDGGNAQAVGHAGDCIGASFKSHLGYFVDSSSFRSDLGNDREVSDFAGRLNHLAHGVFILAHAGSRGGPVFFVGFVGNINAEGHVGATKVEFQDLGTGGFETPGRLLPSLQIGLNVRIVGDNRDFLTFLAALFHQAKPLLQIQAVFGRKDMKFLFVQPPVARLIIYVGKGIEGLFDRCCPPTAFFGKLQLIDSLGRWARSNDERISQLDVADFYRQREKVFSV